ncbi:Protein CBG10385 [Caenorhabditis briggsae]|uniref:Protein CBG10385 n=1 Tax=Caenorhabditis briggsae TaxID=6238 RepID=E3CU15_CAEBR|nr:Protein CBG10385 [Caenorhabditis briggsae]CBX33050.1 Protein CBG10385 [Caenorhabditis briggsae]
MFPFEAKATSTAAAYKAENDKRNSWISQKKLPMDESKQIGSSALAKISAAYQTANEGISAIGASFVSDIIKSKRREESLLKKEVVKVTMEDVQKITMLAMKEDSPERDRDALLAILSFNVMLRASEAAKIKWAGVTQKDEYD